MMKRSIITGMIITFLLVSWLAGISLLVLLFTIINSVLAKSGIFLRAIRLLTLFSII